MSSRAKRQRRLRQARSPSGASGSHQSSTPRLLVEAWSQRPSGDPTIAHYCADPLSDIESGVQFKS